jgi:hypothetical protein
MCKPAASILAESGVLLFLGFFHFSRLNMKETLDMKFFFQYHGNVTGNVASKRFSTGCRHCQES